MRFPQTLFYLLETVEEEEEVTALHLIAPWYTIHVFLQS
jgi:hypothetical protein